MKKFPGSLHDIAYHLPEKVIKNREFAAAFPDWNVTETEKKTGVFERHIASPNETAYDLALVATKKLIKTHPYLPSIVDAVIFCTQSPDYLMPSNAFLLQKDLNLKRDILAFDYNLACSGYVYGLLIASSLIKTGVTTNVLLVTADTYSRYLAPNDRSTRMLFGDGASATWVGADKAAYSTSLINSFEDFLCASDGRGWDKFFIKSGGARHPVEDTDEGDLSAKISMNGLQVVNFVNHSVTPQIVELLQRNNLETSQIDQYFLHQASGLAIEIMAKKLSVDRGKVFSNIMKIGNTVSSSLPILIKDYFCETPLSVGSQLVLCGFGVGFSSASLFAIR